MNLSLGELGVSPIKAHGVHVEGNLSLGKRKMEKVLVAQGEKSLDVATKVARILNVSPEQIVTFSKNSEYDRLMNLVKMKINPTKNERKIVKFLTLAPVVWSINKFALDT